MNGKSFGHQRKGKQSIKEFFFSKSPRECLVFLITTIQNVSFHLQRVERKEKRKRKERKMQEENAKGPRAGGSARNFSYV